MADHDDFDADFNDDSARNRRMFLWLIGGLTAAAAAGVALCGGVIWLIAARFDEIPLFGEFATAEMPPLVHETREEKRAWAQLAFADPPPFAVDRRPVETLFRQVAEACQAEDHVAFRQLVDGDAYWNRVKESGLIQSLTRADDRWYNDEIPGTLEVPAPYERFTFQAVTPGHDSNEAIAYVFAWEEGWITEMRWWLIKRGNSWRVYDWESLQTGNRYSRRHAAYLAEITGVAGHEAALTALADADTAIEADRRLDAVREIRKAAEARVPDMFQSEHRLDVAFAWARAGLAIHERQAYKDATSEDLEQTPGLLLGWAMSESVAGNHAQALDLIDRFQQAVGGGPNVDRVRGDSLFALGRFDEAADAYVRLLNRTPEDAALRSELAQLLPADRVDAVIDSLKPASDPAAETVMLASAVSDQPEILSALETYLAEVQPDSGELLLVRGDRLAAEQSFDEAAAVYQSAFEKLPPATDTEDASEAVMTASRSDAVSRIVMMFCTEDRAWDAYEHAPDRQQAFEEILYYAEEYGLNPDQVDEVVARHLEEFPDDPVALARAATAATESGDADEALALILRAAEHDQTGGYGYLVVAGLLGAGQWDKAEAWVREHPSDVYAFESLAEHLAEQEEWETLVEISDVIEAGDANARHIAAVRKAKALTALGRFGDAETLLAETYQRVDEEWLRSMLLSQWYSLSADAGRPPERIADAVGVDAFGPLIATAELEHDFETAATLEQAWRERGGGAADLLPPQVHRLWRQKDYNAIVQAVRGVGIDVVATDEQGAAVADPFIRSLLRLKRFDEARVAALRVYDATADATLLTVTCIVSADWKRASDAAAVLGEFRCRLLFADADAGPALDQSAAADFRRQLRRNAYDFLGTSSTTLLLKHPPGDDAEALAVRLRRALDGQDDLRIERIEFPTVEDEVLFVIRDGTADWLITIGNDRFSKTDETAAATDEQLATALEEHSGWIDVDRPAGNRSERPTSRFAARIAAAFADAEPLAVHVFSDSASTLIPWTDTLPAFMSIDDFDPRQQPGAEPYWLTRTTTNNVEAEPAQQPLRELAEAFAERATGDVFLVEGTLPIAHNSVSLRLKVDEVISQPYMTEVVGTIDSDLPDALAGAYGVRPDDRLVLNSWNIRRWFRAGGKAGSEWTPETAGPRLNVPVEAPRPADVQQAAPTD